MLKEGGFEEEEAEGNREEGLEEEVEEDIVFQN